MKMITFTIHGNQEDLRGNPIPYLRTTQKSQWTPAAKRYQEWKRKVVASYLDALEEVPKIERADFGDMHDLLDKKPIANTGKKAHMKLKITFGSKHHADCDNIFKGIADALFMNDKLLAGEFDYEYGDAGKVEILIRFY